VKRNPLWRVSVTAQPDAEDAIGWLLQTQFSETPSSFTDAKTGKTTITVYCRNKPDWAAISAQLKTGLRHIANSGIRIGQWKVSLARMKTEDWAHSWKRHFKPIQVGRKLLIKPSWSRLKPKRGQAVVVLDPGLSFGTGQHPTTAFCLKQLVVHRRVGEKQPLLDLGTGSGILAIAAAKMGYSPIKALDFDPESIRVAKVNARRNHQQAQIRFLLQDLTKLPLRTGRKYCVICANLISTLLVGERDRILARLEMAGILVVAGILRAEFAMVQKAYEAAGMRLVTAEASQEWKSGVFERKRSN
jgi:ribosomal protein L11 methyltransferase